MSRARSGKDMRIRKSRLQAKMKHEQTALLHMIKMAVLAHTTGEGNGTSWLRIEKAWFRLPAEVQAPFCQGGPLKLQ
jgi:hypothetical protein